MRRTLDVWLYDDVDELRRAALLFSPGRDVAHIGGICQTRGYIFPRPPAAWFGLVRLHRGQLDIETIVHECTHAAMEIYFADCTSWNSRTRAHFRTDNETIAYLTGELASRIHAGLHRLGATH